MTKVERIEFLQEIKQMMGELLDQKIDKSVNEAVDKAVDSKINIAIEKAIAPLREEIADLRRTVESLKKEVADFRRTVESLEKEVRDISRAVAVIEVEHGRKLDILFDAFTMSSEKHEENKKRIIWCEKKIEKHDGELFYFKSKLEKA